MGSSTYLLSLLVTPQDEWTLHDPLGGKPEGLSNQERELIQQFPGIWAEDNPLPHWLTKNHAPVVTEFEPGATPVRNRQYLLPLEARVGICHI